MVTVKVKRLHQDAKIPKKSTKGSAGYDVRACMEDEIQLSPGNTVKVPTGLAFAIPEGYEIQVRSRSGFASPKHAVFVTNGPGTVDSDFRGEVHVILSNIHRFRTLTIQPGDRIAQLVVAEVIDSEMEEEDELVDPATRTGGFGSTGVS